MKVSTTIFLLLEKIDLGDRCHGAYWSEPKCIEEVDKRNADDLEKWLKHSIERYYVKGWHYEKQELI
jgi:hypothetical protein